MREIEFLPESYTFALKKRQFVRIQFWLTSLIVAMLMLWAGFDAARVHAAENRQARLQQELEESAHKVTQREQLRVLRDRLQLREKVDSSLGLQVEASRILSLIDQCAPASIALTDLEMETAEHVRTISQQASARDGRDKQTDRDLLVSVKGYAPSSIEVAALMENLDNSRILTGTATSLYARDANEGKIAGCEFCIEFHISLNGGGGQ